MKFGEHSQCGSARSDSRANTALVVAESVEPGCAHHRSAVAGAVRQKLSRDSGSPSPVVTGAFGVDYLRR